MLSLVQKAGVQALNLWMLWDLRALLKSWEFMARVLQALITQRFNVGAE